MRRRPISTRTLRVLEAVMFALVGGVIVSAALLGLDLLREEPLTRRRLEVAAAIVPVFALIMALSGWLASFVEKRRSHSSINATSVRRALGSGRPPALAQDDEWVPKLHRMVRSDRWELWLSVVVFGAMSVFGSYRFVSGEEPAAYTLVLTLLFIVLVIWSLFHYGRRRRRIERLIHGFMKRSVEDQPRP